MANATTPMPIPSDWSSGPWIRLRIAAYTITPEPMRISTPSAAAATFSNFSCP